MSAATAAGLAIERGTTVQDVDYGALKERLLASGQMLDFVATPSTGGGHGLDKSKLPGIIVGDFARETEGFWLSLPKRCSNVSEDTRAPEVRFPYVLGLDK